MLQLLIATLIVITGSALCSGTEAALLSVSLLKVRQLAQTQKPAAVRLLSIRQKINRPIATIVILNNLFNILGSVMIGGIAASVLGEAWLGVFSGVLTFAIILGGEILPKTLGERYSEPFALLMSLPVQWLTWLFKPLVILLEKITTPLVGVAVKPTTNEAEIKLLARIGYQEGIIEDDEADMIQRVFQLNDLTAADVMTPRILITYLRGELTLSECQQEIITSQHTRILVIEDSIDNITGIVLKDELLTAMIEGKQQEPIASLNRPVRFVPETIRADKLLKVFQETREHLAVALDEYGGVAGVVTLEDVLEVLTGEIVDETDRSVDLQAIARQRRQRLLHNEGIEESM